ncbi:MAG: yhgE [Herbinix sp.]|nr:yhgE [Herbinix sp.]
MKNSRLKKLIIRIVVVAAIIIIPLLYSYFYLGAFWDPYSRLKSLPVAVVNNDIGAMIT